MANVSYMNVIRKYRWRLRLGISLVFGVITLGVAGYILLEKYTFVEAFYMTIITLSTVGFGEVRPLDSAGRLFTSLLILLNLGTFAYALTSITTFIAEGDLRKYLNYLRVYKQIDQLTNHIIVCGYGRNGKQVCEVLAASKQPFVVIEKDTERLELLRAQKEILFTEGNATEDAVLDQAGVTKARALISTLPSDPDNVYVVLTAKEKNPQIQMISRASDESSEAKLKIAGADHVIMPERIGGTYMASLIVKPDLMAFISRVAGRGGFDFGFEEIACSRFIHAGKEVLLKDIPAFKKSGVFIIGIKQPDGKFVSSPPPQTHITHDTQLFVFGSENELQSLKEMLAAHLVKPS